MANLDLTKYGITGSTVKAHNPSYEYLYEEEMKKELTGFDKGQETELGAVNVMTGIFTGRSPKDKYIIWCKYVRDLLLELLSLHQSQFLSPTHQPTE